MDDALIQQEASPVFVTRDTKPMEILARTSMNATDLHVKGVGVQTQKVASHASVLKALHLVKMEEHVQTVCQDFAMLST